ncbi:MAG: MFS transporter [Gemmatimonadota bacterium]
MESTPDRLLRIKDPRGKWVLATTVLGSGVAMLTATVVNIALPTIGRDLGADISDLQWILNGYLLTLAALILLGGSLGDRYGRRRVYVIGIVWFGVASVLCALAPNVNVLIAARALQGIGGALLTPGSLAIIQAGFHPEDRPAAIGAWSGLTGIAGAIGPLVGGYLVEAAGWPWIFLVSAPVAAFVVWAALRHVPESRNSDADGPLDISGAILGFVGLAGITYPIIQVSEQGWTPLLVGIGVAGLAALAAFVRVEGRSDHPMLPLGIFSSRQFTSANLVTFVVYAALGGVFFLLIVHLQTVVGYSALMAGAAPLPITFLMLIGSAPAGRLAQRIGPRLPLTVGPLLIAGGMLLMRRIGAGADYVTAILPAMVVFGVGLTLTVAPVTATVLAAAEDRHAGVASGVNNAVSRAGQLIAVAALPALVGLTGADYLEPQAFAAGFRQAMLLTAVVTAAGAALAWLGIRDDVLEAAPEREGEPYHCPVDGAPYRT